MTTAPDQQPPAPVVGQPTIIINNSSSATASASAVAGGFGRPRRKRQSFQVHLWLFLFTAGVGNVFYALHVNRWNRHRGW
ncbi:hypothetical protein ACFYM7_34730 [Streptomyces cyaneofuscatus]|uniref:hypothetical protein n=1 Tax=Streptomyces cyaneofuscatus TaxID=66883 RepID=UPI003695D2BA